LFGCLKKHLNLKSFVQLLIIIEGNIFTLTKRICCLLCEIIKVLVFFIFMNENHDHWLPKEVHRKKHEPIRWSYFYYAKRQNDVDSSHAFFLFWYFSLHFVPLFRATSNWNVSLFIFTQNGQLIYLKIIYMRFTLLSKNTNAPSTRAQRGQKRQAKDFESLIFFIKKNVAQILTLLYLKWR